MVKIAIAGGSGEVAREVVDALIAAKKHDILLLSRQDTHAQVSPSNLTWIKVDYGNGPQLKKILHDTHTVLSFITTQTDPNSMAQKSLIDACVDAGVKRFAPSEWATSSLDSMPWYSGKAEIRQYLKEINRKAKVLEYTLFQPGWFTNYFTHPYKSASHVSTFETQFDFQNRRAIVPQGDGNDRITLTTAQDLANIVALAIDYQGEWPVVGGIKGCELSVTEFIRLGERIRGSVFDIERLRIDDLRAGTIKSSWLPHVSHPAIPAEQAESLAGMFTGGMTLGISTGALNVSDEWNRLLPKYKFTQPDEFLSEAWRGKP